MKKIMTVAGEISAVKCTKVLSHEHLFIDLRHQAHASAPERPLTAADHAMLMCDPYALRDNLVIDDFSAAADECAGLLNAGCNTVVDCSTVEIGRDPEKLLRLAENTGMNIVMGCGNYTGDIHPEWFINADEDKCIEKLLAEIRYGINGIRPGIIGEIGTSMVILPSEYKALRVAAAAQLESGLAMQVHIYPWSCNGLEVVQMLTSLGVAPDRVVICHSDVAPDTDYIRELLENGVYVQLDNFGKEFTPDIAGFAGGSFAKDSERVTIAAGIIESGYGDQLLMTNDICLKCMLKYCGGAGYRHIFDDIVPQFAAYGIDETYLNQHILHDNPLAMLSY